MIARTITRILGIIVIAIIWLLVLVSYLPAQSGLPANVEATTSCLNGRVTTIVNLATLYDYDSTGKYVRTDSADEVIGHELIHQRQAKKWFPGCPPYGMHPELLLRDEVEAYCWTRGRYLIRTRQPKEEVNKEIEAILMDQFNGMPAHDVAAAWESGCP